MDIQHIILGIIQINPMTGYEIKQFFDKSLTFFSGVSYGSIYPTLKKLEKKGFVTVQLEVQDGRPNRKIYTITDQGHTEYLDSLIEPLKPTQLKNDLLTRLFFFSDVPEEKRVNLVQEQIGMMHQKQTVLKELEPFVLESADAFQLMCYRSGIEMLTHSISVMESIKQKIQQTSGK